MIEEILEGKYDEEKPLEGFESVIGYPRIVTIKGIDDAYKYIDDLCNDVIKSLTEMSIIDDDADQQFKQKVAPYMDIYLASMDDVINQINTLDYKPGIIDRARHYFKKGAVDAKLQGLLNGADFRYHKSYYKHIRGVVESLGFTVEKTKRSGSFIVKEKTKKKDDEFLPSPEDTTPTLQNEIIKYLLGERLVDKFQEGVETIYKKDGYPKKLHENIQRQLTRVQAKNIMMGFLLTSSLAVGGAFSYNYLDEKREQEEKITFMSSLDIKQYDMLQSAYDANFSDLNNSIVSFRTSSAWIDPYSRSSLYNCMGQHNLTHVDSFQLETLLDADLCLDRLSEDLEQQFGAPTQTVVRHFLDNFRNFSDYFLPLTEETLHLERKIDSAYNAQIEQIESFEKETGYSLPEAYRRVQRKKAIFDQRKSANHQHYTLGLSPVEFFAIVFAELNYQETIGQLDWYIRPAQLRDQRGLNSQKGAEFMKRYLIHENPTSIRTSMFIAPQADYESAALIVNNFTEAVNRQRR